MKIRNLSIMLCLCLLLPFSAAAQQTDAPPISPALDAHLDELDALTVQIRGLQPLAEVERYFPTRDEVRAFLEESFNEELTEEIVLRETQFYRAFDFVDPDFDLIEVYLALFSAQVAGYYNPETKAMNTLLMSGDTLGNTLPLVERITYVHEYTHALQDQYYDLEALRSGLAEEEPDLAIAILSLIEGDATLVMNEYAALVVQEDPGAAIEMLLNPDVLASAEIPEGTPAILEAELQFPYLVGQYFVQTLRNNGGWAAVDAAFSNLPQSSEQIMHPEKYLAGEQPQPIAVTNALAALDGGGWAVLAERTLGEFYLRRYLINQLDQPTVNAAATGWGGDRYILYYDAAADARAWVLNMGWDTAADATEFAAAYRQYAALRTEAEAAALPDDVTCWRDAAQADALCLWVEEATARTVLAYAPSQEEAARMIAAQR